MAERSDELASDRIQQDIERTRQQMSGTIDEIQERLRPSRILHDATASVREASADSVRRVLSHAGVTAERTAGQARAASTAAAGFARSHPVPLAAIVGGLAVVLIRALVIARRRRPPAVTDEELSQWDDSPAGGRAPLNDMHVHREFQDWAEPSNATRRTRSSLTSWFAENPLAIGAAVAAAGLVVSVSRPNQEPPVLGTDSVRR